MVRPKNELRVDLGGELVLIQIYDNSISISHKKDGKERWVTVKNDKGVRLYTQKSKSKDLWK